MEEKVAPIKRHYKEDYEARCPNCGSEDISEVTGWCYNHGNPTFEGDRRFCSDDPSECGFIAPVKDAYFCNDCDTIYDDRKMTNWNWGNVWYGNCPVGKEVEETPKQYGDRLYESLSKYNEQKIRVCLEQKYYIEAIIELHRHIFEQLRYLLIKKIKGIESIPLDENDSRYRKVVILLKEMNDSSLLDFAFIYKRLTEEERGKIKELNTSRNVYVHAWLKERRRKYSEKQTKIIIDDAMD
jgi:hypothetical protein